MRIIVSGVSVALTIVLNACGNAKNSVDSGDQVQPPVEPSGIPVGLWRGQSNTNRSIEGFVLDDKRVFFSYSVAGSSEIGGLVYGAASVDEKTYSLSIANLRDFNFEGLALDIVPLSANYVSKRTIDGSIEYKAGSSVFNLTYVKAFDQAPYSFDQLIGVYDLLMFTSGATPMRTTMTVYEHGGFNTVSPWCISSGSVSPLPTGSGYWFSSTFASGQNCAVGGRAFQGVARINAQTRQMLALSIDSTMSVGLVLRDLHR